MRKDLSRLIKKLWANGMIKVKNIESYLKKYIQDIIKINLFLLIIFLAKIPDEITFTGIIKAFLPFMFFFILFIDLRSVKKIIFKM